jgi:hypothetical protein
VAVLKRMLPPNNMAIGELSEAEGIFEASLHNCWVEARDKVQLLPDADAGPEGWSSRDKFAAVRETKVLNEADLAEYCRKRGLYPAQFSTWRVAREQANDCDRARTARLGQATKAEMKWVKDLERELARKDHALAETAVLLVLRKKAAAIWGATWMHDQPPTSPNRRCSDQRGRNRRRAACQGLCGAGDQRSHSAVLDERPPDPRRPAPPRTEPGAGQQTSVVAARGARTFFPYVHAILMCM